MPDLSSHVFKYELYKSVGLRHHLDIGDRAIALTVQIVKFRDPAPKKSPFSIRVNAEARLVDAMGQWHQYIPPEARDFPFGHIGIIDIADGRESQEGKYWAAFKKNKAVNTYQTVLVPYVPLDTDPEVTTAIPDNIFTIYMQAIDNTPNFVSPFVDLDNLVRFLDVDLLIKPVQRRLRLDLAFWDALVALAGETQLTTKWEATRRIWANDPTYGRAATDDLDRAEFNRLADESRTSTETGRGAKRLIDDAKSKMMDSQVPYDCIKYMAL